MSKQIKNIFSDSDCPSQEVMLKYTSNLLKGGEKHAFERHLAGCAFCSEAMEGLSLMDSNEVRLDVFELNKKIDEAGRPGRIIAWPMTAAASVAILLVAGTWFYLHNEQAGYPTKETAVVNKAIDEDKKEAFNEEKPAEHISPPAPEISTQGLVQDSKDLPSQTYEWAKKDSDKGTYAVTPPEISADDSPSKDELFLSAKKMEEPAGRINLSKEGEMSGAGLNKSVTAKNYGFHSDSVVLPTPASSPVLALTERKDDRKDNLSQEMLAMVDDQFGYGSPAEEDKKEVASSQRSAVHKAKAKAYKKMEVAKEKSLDDCPNCPKKTTSEISQNNLQVLSMDYAMKKYQMKEYDLAHKQFEEILNENSSPGQADNAKIFNALSLVHLNREDEALKTVNSMLAGPTGSVTDAAKWIKASILIDKKDIAGARVILQDLTHYSNDYQIRAKEILETLK
jgi:hypothetical protein